MRNRRITATALALLTALTLTGGPALAESADAVRTVTGRVTTVSVSSITMDLGTYTTPARPGAPDTSPSATVSPEATPAPDSPAAPEATIAPEATTAPDVNTTATPDSNATVAPDSSAPQAPEQRAQRADSGFTASGETLTFSITSSTSFTFGRRSIKGSISDISVGSILTVQLSGDAATAVTILETRGLFGRGGRFFGGMNNWRGGNGRFGNRNSGPRYGYGNNGPRNGDGTRGKKPNRGYSWRNMPNRGGFWGNSPQNNDNRNGPQDDGEQNGGVAPDAMPGT